MVIKYTANLGSVKKAIEISRALNNVGLTAPTVIPTTDGKEYVKNEYDLTDEEVEEIFDNYGLEYQDRAIVGTIFSDKYDMIEEEKFSFGYDKQPYFDDESFGNDLLESESYLELESGRIVYYCY